MIRITRQTLQGWKTFIYANEDMYKVGRPAVSRNARMDEVQKADEIINEQEEKAEKIKTSPEKEGGYKDKWDVSDFKDYLDDMRKQGFSDEKKLQGMVDKATEIAKQETKESPKGRATRAEVLGILTGFFKEK